MSTRSCCAQTCILGASNRFLMPCFTRHKTRLPRGSCATGVHTLHHGSLNTLERDGHTGCLYCTASVASVSLFHDFPDAMHPCATSLSITVFHSVCQNLVTLLLSEYSSSMPARRILFARSYRRVSMCSIDLIRSPPRSNPPDGFVHWNT